MAQDQQTMSVGADWTQLTNADVTAITLQVHSGAVFLRGTTDTTTPTEKAGLLLGTGETILNKNVSDLFNLSGADRVWAKRAGSSDASVYVDHG